MPVQNMPFLPGNHVRLIHNPGRTGIVSPSGCREQSGVIQVQIQFGDGALSWMRATQVERLPNTVDARGDFIRGRVAGPDSMRRILMHEKMGGRLSGVLYSMEASDTKFLPYQFKPVLKLIESPCNSLLIADEVGLGKTIEAGLIWTELRARTGAQRLLVVCPAKLKLKWLRELARRFGVRAAEASAKEVVEHLQEYRRNNSHGFALVASYQALRPPSGWEDAPPESDPRAGLAHLLNDAAQGEPPLDLLVMDEAHYMRNPETKAFDLGELATDAAVHRVFLSATPLHTSNLNLYSLLRLLDPDTFNNEQAFSGIIEANAPLVKLRDTLVSPASKVEDALSLIDEALLNPYVRESQMLGALRASLQEPGVLSSPSRRAACAYQAERINLLGHAFSRTRKRDVTRPEDRVHRNVAARKVVMTPAESKVYQEVTEMALDFAAANNLPSGFLAVTPQRLVSSSIVAALIHWTKPPGARLTDSNDDDRENRPFVQFLHQRLHGRFDLAGLRKADTKFHLLLEELGDYWREHPGQKVIIFSTFRPTVDYLAERLAEHSIDVITLKGGAMVSSQEVIDEFASADGADVLISTEVGGEGLDMQFASTIINYDLPWNPMVVEQRIGRIDRIGQQQRQILILNLLQAGTIDERIYDRLYDRLDLFRNSIGDLESVVGPVLRGIPVGQMSPFTAGVFLFAALSLVTLLPALSRRAVLRRAGKIAALLGGSFCAITALAYATGTPLFYSGGVVPMAFLTAIAFVALNLAQLLASRVDENVHDFFFGDGTQPATPKPFAREQTLIIGLTTAVFAIVALAASFYLRTQQTSLKNRIAAELTAIATLKVNQITAWRDERLWNVRWLMRPQAQCTKRINRLFCRALIDKCELFRGNYSHRGNDSPAASPPTGNVVAR